ncbi:Glutathione synthetase ATP-binding protein [Glarea lozoyensis ATCC 20868]|uniref:Glutathione synthetase ATP-binding protein n=1 Tax=Glarea lozoyensis (strain ATCC 20868 / MF5171) TaxID=1116229 RepID=S3DNV4_GLAL2|nr:Glutathione synthetase ATP-binding protein [Glarea lozoyensis ATCC 20868]EPE33766.1 Glutathione synthetase ATP-binding protein [Glarea lozoyensis ATCC 20868]
MAEIRPIKRLLIANRGEIATRILSTTRELSIPTYTLHTPSDTLHTHHSTHSIALPSPSSYLDISHLITLVKHYAIDTIHPGYGFLSESAEFSQRMLTEANCHVIGPGPAILSRTGDKLQARALAQECNVPVLPALQNPTSSPSDVETFAQKVGYPIVVKAVDGGGGRGIRIVYQSSELERSVSLALKESPSTLIFAEKAAISGYRHIEVQIIGDGTGAVRHLWERECSIQRRFQKVVEFAPSSLANRRLVSKVIEATLKMARQVRFLSLGTFEFLVSEEKEEYWFLEVNPRIQVEHTVTEQLALGVDLVRLQVLIAQGYRLEDVFPRFLGQDPEVPPPVYSIQLRVTAEDVANNWALSVGKIKGFGFPMGNGVRVDTHLTSGHPAVIGTDFDSLLAKTRNFRKLMGNRRFQSKKSTRRNLDRRHNNKPKHPPRYPRQPRFREWKMRYAMARNSSPFLTKKRRDVNTKTTTKTDKYGDNHHSTLNYPS